jgi:hypothetical protein
MRRVAVVLTVASVELRQSPWTGPHDCVGQAAVRAPLRFRIDGGVEPRAGPRSDRSGDFGEGHGHPGSRQGIDGEFVVAASKIPHESVPGDNRLGCLARS